MLPTPVIQEALAIEIVRFPADGSKLSPWDEYVSRHPEATPYHFSTWLTIIERCFEHQVFLVLCTSGHDVVGGVPLVLMTSRLFGRFAVSIPFVNYGGMLADSDAVERSLWEAITSLGRELHVSHVELRHTRSRLFIEQRRQHKVSMVLALEDTSDRQWQGFNAKLRNQIRKAERSGLTARFGGAGDVDGFYEVFAQNMRDLGTPVYARRFFEMVLNAFPEQAQVCSVLHGNTVIAAGMTFGFRESLQVPWASSLRAYRDMCPNNLLYWTLIQQAIKKGYRTFDFGRSTPGEGTYKFKEQWGARPLALIWEYWSAKPGECPDLSPKNAKYQMAIKVWQRLPVWVTKLIGPGIVRNIP